MYGGRISRKYVRKGNQKYTATRILGMDIRKGDILYRANGWHPNRPTDRKVKVTRRDLTKMNIAFYWNGRKLWWMNQISINIDGEYIKLTRKKKTFRK